MPATPWFWTMKSKNSLRSALKLVMSPSWLTNESTCQFEFGPFHRFQLWPASEMPVWICEPTGWMLAIHIVSH